MISQQEAAGELLSRRRARRLLLEYIKFTSRGYKISSFSEVVCSALDKFIDDVAAGKRPILILQAPPQHGKSEIVSRKLPAYLMGRFPEWRIGAASYNDDLAHGFAQNVRRFLASPEQDRLFPGSNRKRKFDRNTIGEISNPLGDGHYFSGGVATAWSGKPLDIGIIDDPTKDQKEALSLVTKENHWNWYQSTFTARLSENSGQIIMATSWAEDDLPARIAEAYRGSPRLTHLRFPAINGPHEVGYNPAMAEGALVPELHSLEKLKEQKALMSDYWWSALYQQSAKALGGNVFKEAGIQYYLPKDIPKKFDKVIISWDCTFKDTDGTDFVVGQVWGKLGANSYLLDQICKRMGFTATLKAVIALREKWPQAWEILIEDKANGPAVIDVLKAQVPGILPIEPDGSKLARAHAVTSYWEALNIWLPHEDIAPWIRHYVSEITAFPAAAHDDQVDSMTQALRRLYPLYGKLAISQAALDQAMGIK
jgi:predicted phage terminase large subunit-like protein